MSEVPGYLYALRDEAGKAAENLRRCTALAERELAEAKGTLDRLERIASKAELAAELVAASDLEPSMSSDVPPESGLTRIEREPRSGESKDRIGGSTGGTGAKTYAPERPAARCAAAHGGNT